MTRNELWKSRRPGLAAEFDLARIRSGALSVSRKRLHKLRRKARRAGRRKRGAKR